MSYQSNRAVRYTDSDGNPVDVTESVPLPVSEDTWVKALLQELLNEMRLTNKYLAEMLGDNLGEER